MGFKSGRESMLFPEACLSILGELGDIGCYSSTYLEAAFIDSISVNFVR